MTEGTNQNYSSKNKQGKAGLLKDKSGEFELVLFALLIIFLGFLGTVAWGLISKRIMRRIRFGWLIGLPMLFLPYLVAHLLLPYNFADIRIFYLYALIVLFVYAGAFLKSRLGKKKVLSHD